MSGCYRFETSLASAPGGGKGEPMSLSAMKIKTRVFIILGVIYLLASVAVVVLVNHSMKQQAMEEAESKALMLLNQSLATHTYLSQRLKPNLFALTEPVRSPDFFDPIWMSSTFVLREIDKYTRSFQPTQYSYKECALNARSPENEADPYEKSFLKDLAENPKLEIRSAIRELNGKPYFVILRRGEVMEASCLRCHSTPDRAPGDLLKIYGTQRGFHRQVGDVVQAISIRIPLDLAYGAANRFSLQLSALLLLILFALFITKLSLDRHYIYNPIVTLQDKASRIASGETPLGETIPVPQGPELRNLIVSFNKMSASLKQVVDNLECRIAERTADLERLNEDLERDNRALELAKAEISQQRNQLRTLSTRLVEVEETERQQLALELHDQVCQNLASINIVLETLMIRAQREPIDHLLSRLADLGAVAEQTGEITRDIMEGLRPTVLDHYGLMGGLRQLGSHFSQRTGIDTEILGEESDPRLNPNVELALFRIAQEALNNVAKHARDSQVVLTKEVNQGIVRLVIADNGTGFDQHLVAHPKNGRGWGLMTMTERAMAIGGHCRIESQPGQGTRVVVEVPR
jgi:signal transduction histidine kinase